MYVDVFFFHFFFFQWEIEKKLPAFLPSFEGLRTFIYNTKEKTSSNQNCRQFDSILLFSYFLLFFKFFFVKPKRISFIPA